MTLAASTPIPAVTVSLVILVESAPTFALKSIFGASGVCTVTSEEIVSPPAFDAFTRIRYVEPGSSPVTCPARTAAPASEAGRVAMVTVVAAPGTRCAR